MQDGRVEILLAAYNGAAYIREQIDSILCQTDTNWHLTVSDDGSTDGTDAILNEYVRRYPERIGRVCSGQRFGGAKAHFFWLMQACDAPYMAFSDQDDVWYAGKLERLRQAMLEAEARLEGGAPVLVFSDQTVTDEALRPLSPSLMRYQKQYFGAFDYRSILMQNVVTGGAMMINRALGRLALPGEALPQVIMHDWWMAAVAARFGEIVYLDEPLGVYRQHGDNSVGAKDVRSARYIRRMLLAPGHVREALLEKKAQARAFEQAYDARLNDGDRAFLQRFSRAHSGPLFYWENRERIHGAHRLAGMMLLG